MPASRGQLGAGGQPHGENRQLTDFLTQLKGVKKTTSGWTACCPAHDDRNPSLSITLADDGKVLACCHRGCSIEAITAAAGLEPLDLFPASSHSKPNGPAPIVAMYDYRDSDGVLAFQVVRRADKSFFQRRPDGNGGWLNNLNGVSRTLYRLPELLAADSGEWVFIVEGEDDADRLATLGLTATCNPGGAGKWRSAYSKRLRDRRPAILSDNDQPGRAHASKIARALHGIAAEIRIVALPDLPDKGDVSDWLDAGGTKEELLRIVERTQRYEPTDSDQHSKIVTIGQHPTELWLAEKLVARHGTDLRYCRTHGWLAWDGKRWRRDDTGEVQRRTKETIRHLLHEAAALDDSTRRRRLADFAVRSETATRIGNVIRLAESEQPIPIRAEQLDDDPWLFNCVNGTIDLKTGRLRPHSQEDLISKLAPVKYASEAACPLFRAFLARIVPSEALRQFIQRSFGHALTGVIRQHILHILWGTGPMVRLPLSTPFRWVWVTMA